MVALLGMLIAVGLWWVYFDFVSHRKPIHSGVIVRAWMYLHLPLIIAIAGGGAAILNVVEHGGEEISSEVGWLLTGCVAVVLVCISFITRTIELPETHLNMYREGGRLMLISAVLIGLMGWVSLPAIPFLGAIILLLLLPIYYAFRSWIESFETTM
jgi:low temperature requirement protein LtrA